MGRENIASNEDLNENPPDVVGLHVPHLIEDQNTILFASGKQVFKSSRPQNDSSGQNESGGNKESQRNGIYFKPQQQLQNSDNEPPLSAGVSVFQPTDRNAHNIEYG